MGNRPKDWYTRFFRDYYLTYFHYKKEAPLKIAQEVNFICDVLRLHPRAKILDLACGPGRHAVELARRGFLLTGVDFNKEFLSIAQRRARQRGVSLKLLHGDMRNLSFRGEFDAVVFLYTSFGYFPDKKDNMGVLRAISQSLKKHGLLVLDLPNMQWSLCKMPKKTWNKVSTSYILEERVFNETKSVLENKITIIKPGGVHHRISTFLRLYTMEELKKMLREVNLKIVHVFGSYSAKEEFDTHTSPRMIILAAKK